MAELSMLFLLASLACLVMTNRTMSGLLLAAAVGFWALPHVGAHFGVTVPAGFDMAEQPEPGPRVAFKAPGGKRLTLADFRGQVVLLNIWASWCATCREEMPSMDRLQELHGDDGLKVLAISVGDEGATEARRALREVGAYNLGLYVDSKQITQNALGSGPLPISLLIDREGNIVGRRFGAAEWDSPEALALVRRYLDG